MSTSPTEPGTPDNSSATDSISPGGQAAILLVVVLGMMLLCAGPAWLMAGSWGLIGLSLAGFLCLIPGWVVFLFASLYRVGQTQAMIILGASTFRMLFVAGGTLFVVSQFRVLNLRSFVVWVVVMYFATLAVETWLVLRAQTSADGEPPTNGSPPADQSAPEHSVQGTESEG